MSCLFNSLSYFLNQDSYSIRQQICDYLENNNKIMEDIDTTIILNLENNDYITTMRNTSTWGGAIEIQTACNIWNLKIIVKNIRDINGADIEFIPIHNNFLTTIYLEWSGGHYEPVR
jgi:hypothetical protein